MPLLANQLDAMLTLASSDPLGHNYDYPILSLESGWAILTNHILLMLLVFLFMLWFMPWVANRVATGKSGTSHDYVTKGSLAHMVEVICVFFRDQVARPVLGERTDRFMPFIWTVFFFILFNNLVGMVPLMDLTALTYEAFAGDHTAEIVAHEPGTVDPHATVGHGLASEAADHDDAPGLAEHADDSLAHAGDAHGADHGGHGGHHRLMTLGPFILFQDLTVEGKPASHFHGIGGTPTGNLAVTSAMALIAIIAVIAAGIAGLGLGGFVHHLTLDAPVALWPLTILLEIIGLMAKPFALCVRLFANMTAGHVMLAAMVGFAAMAWNGLAVDLETGVISTGGAFAAILIAIGSIAFATAIGLLELLVAFIHAYIFAFLTTMFISMFQPHGHHDEHHEAHGHDEHHVPVIAEEAIRPRHTLDGKATQPEPELAVASRG